MKKSLKNNYIVIQGWMIEDLALKGNELLVYAIIYGFSQAENQKYSGSLQYLADWTNSTKEGIRKNLLSLVKKGLIAKEDSNISGVKVCSYSALPLSLKEENIEKSQKVDGIQHSCMVSNKVGGYTTKLDGVSNKVGGGIQQSCTNNIEDNIDIIYNSFFPSNIDNIKNKEAALIKVMNEVNEGERKSINEEFEKETYAESLENILANKDVKYLVNEIDKKISLQLPLYDYSYSDFLMYASSKFKIYKTYESAIPLGKEEKDFIGLRKSFDWIRAIADLLSNNEEYIKIGNRKIKSVDVHQRIQEIDDYKFSKMISKLAEVRETNNIINLKAYMQTMIVDACYDSGDLCDITKVQLNKFINERRNE